MLILQEFLRALGHGLPLLCASTVHVQLRGEKNSLKSFLYADDVSFVLQQERCHTAMAAVEIAWGFCMFFENEN